MNLAEHLQGILDLEANSVKEFNELFDANEAIVKENQELIDKVAESALVLDKQHEALTVAKGSQDEVLKQNKTIGDLRSVTAAQKTTIDGLRKQLDTAKKESAKNLKDFKNQKQANTVKQKSIDRLTKLKSTGKSGTRMGELPKIYKDGNESLMVFPTTLRLTIDGVEGEHVTLLYSNSSGIFISLVLAPNGSVTYASVIEDERNVNERTIALIKKNTYKPPLEILQYAESWLYRVNVTQKGNPCDRDLVQHNVKDIK